MRRFKVDKDGFGKIEDKVLYNGCWMDFYNTGRTIIRIFSRRFKDPPKKVVYKRAEKVYIEL